MKLSSLNQSVIETGDSDTTIWNHNPDNDRDWFITGDNEPDYTGRHDDNKSKVEEEKFNRILKSIVKRLNRLEKAIN